MLTIKIDNLALDTIKPGHIRQACPLLFIHGGGATSRCWQNYLSYFAKAGWEVFAINLRGHAPSDREEALAQVTLEDYLDDVDKVIRRLDIASCVLIGHSLGGLIALKTAENIKTVSGLALICSAPPLGIAMEMQNDLPYAGAILKTIWGLMNMKPVKMTYRMAEKTLLNNIDPARRQEVFEMFVAESLVVGYQVAQGVFVNPDKILCPKLVVGCAKDMIASPYIQKSLADFLGADYLGYEQFAHLPMLEDGWEKGAADIAAWLQR